MGAAFFMIMLGGMFIYYAVQYRRRQQFYQKNGVELKGEVMFWEKRRGWQGQKNWPYYVMKVRANGQDYFIETDNSKARKYKNRTDVTIVTPEEQSMPAEVMREYSDKPEMDEIQKKLCELNDMSRSRLTMLKEDIPKPRQYMFIGTFGAILILLGILAAVGEFMR